MKFSTLFALLAVASASQFDASIDAAAQLESESNLMNEDLAELKTLESSLVFLQSNPHLIATNYLRQAQKKITELLKKAESAEGSSNTD